MREILFRGKRTHSRQWAFGFYTQSPSGNFYITETSCGVASPKTVEPETVGQFTGLTDKTGKKIFEGDIIEWFAQGESEHPDFGYIEYDEQSFAWRVCWQKYDPDWLEGSNREYISVIGNIHDNPELLENP